MVGNLNAFSLISVPICIYAVFTNAILLFRFWYCFDGRFSVFCNFCVTFSFPFFVFFFFLPKEYKVYSYFRQRWRDARLSGRLKHTLVIKGGDIENVWVPDPYCYNARESNMIMPPANEEIHSSVSIQPTGDVLYSKGYTCVNIR